MEKPKKIYVAQTSQGVLSVVNEHYPGCTEYVKSEGESEEKETKREVMKSYLLDFLIGQKPNSVSRQELIDFVKKI